MSSKFKSISLVLVVAGIVFSAALGLVSQGKNTMFASQEPGWPSPVFASQEPGWPGPIFASQEPGWPSPLA